MLSGEALDIAFALRAKVGALLQGDGPGLGELREASGLAEGAFERALAELAGIGFVLIDRGGQTEPVVIVLAPLQIYLDDLENQGSDDF
jgi:predicted transcriptional regulator